MYNISCKNIPYLKINKMIINCLLTITPKIIVANPPPIKPSQVFFGDTLIRGVRPKKKPKI